MTVCAERRLQGFHITPQAIIVSRGHTLFRKRGKGSGNFFYSSLLHRSVQCGTNHSAASLTLRVVVWMRIVRRKCVLYLLANIHLSIAVSSILAINSWTVTRYQTSLVVLGTKSGCLQYNVCKDKTITLLGTKTFTITVGLTYLFHDCVRREKATGFPHNSTGNYSLAWPHPVPQEREGVW